MNADLSGTCLHLQRAQGPGSRAFHSSCQTALVKLIDQWMCIDYGDFVGYLSF